MKSKQQQQQQQQQQQHFLTSEKFLHSLDEQGLQDFCSLFEKLVELDKSKQLELKHWQTGYVFALLHSNYNVRRHAQTVLKRLFKWSSIQLVLSFLSEAYENALAAFRDDKEAEWPSGKGMCEAMLTFASVPSLSSIQDLELIAARCLFLCNLPRAKLCDPNVYEKFLTRLLAENKLGFPKLNPTELIQNQTNAFEELTLLRSGSVLTEKELNAIETLAKLDGKNYLSRAINFALGKKYLVSISSQFLVQKWSVLLIKP